MVVENPPPIVTPSIAVRAGVSDPRGTIIRQQTDTAYSDQHMGLGATTELQAGARFYSMLSVVAFGQLGWHSCGYTYYCDGTSRLLGGMLRIEPPSGRARPFFEIGLGWRKIDIALDGGSMGTSASLTYQQLHGPRPRAVLTGTDVRFAVGGALRLASTLELELATDVSLGRYSTWKDRPRGNLDPNAALLPSDDLSDAERGLHGFIGISLGARWLPR